jgi:hypothetical protein
LQDEDEDKGVIHPAVLSTEKNPQRMPHLLPSPVPGFQTKDIPIQIVNEFLLKSN